MLLGISTDAQGNVFHHPDPPPCMYITLSLLIIKVELLLLLLSLLTYRPLEVNNQCLCYVIGLIDTVATRITQRPALVDLTNGEGPSRGKVSKYYYGILMYYIIAIRHISYSVLSFS